MSIRHVYRLGDPLPEGADARALLGGKGAGLAEMARLGIPVPPAFTLTTEVSRHLRRAGAYPEALREQVAEALGWIEERVGRRFGDRGRPLLVSVRSGAPVSMPGMMDTILNLGINDETVEGLADMAGDRRFAFDAYRRLLQMYGNVVMGVDHARFEEAFGALKAELGAPHMNDTEVPVEALERLVAVYRDLIVSETGEPFPQNVQDQLWGAIGAVFASWDNPRARRYRRMTGIDPSVGTACNVQAMVFGNLGEDSGSGVVFTRDPSTGRRALYGEYLPNAQGEDVVAGIRTPWPLTSSAAAPGQEERSLERRQPEVFESIRSICERLERHFRDMQDVEFTVERGRVWLLQTRTGKRTAQAAVRIAVEMVDEELLRPEEAVLRVDASALEQLLHPRLPDPEELAAQGTSPLARGLPASPGAASGRVVFDADEAERRVEAGERVVLLRRETSPEDVHGMKVAEAIVTATGGMTSHAAVVARGLGKTCVAGVSSLDVDERGRLARGRTESGEPFELRDGDVVTVDGSRGLIYRGALEVEAASTMPEFERLMGWADRARRLRVRVNADTPTQARFGRRLGAEGIGLCRTEHMFFAEERLLAMRCLVLADGDAERQRWLGRIEPMLQRDFEAIFEAMDGLPVTIRLLDWPLHEFLPREEREVATVAEALGRPLVEVMRRIEQLSEVNPMLGHRGARVGVTHPDIYRSQARAILGAAVACRERGINPHPEIMLPVVSLAEEVSMLRRHVEEEAERLFERLGMRCEFSVGTMIELPRACLVAGDIAREAAFFSFGTNDLTQTTYGMSRDDAAKFLPTYMEEGVSLLRFDPWVRLDEHGVGQLVRMAAEAGREARPDLHLGLCGEHGGDPASIAFCHRVGLDYVSCSPPRLPVARLAAAQAALRNLERS